MSFPSPNSDRWRETADAATRAQYPDEYWCVADDCWVQHFWGEQTVTREEYLANSGKRIVYEDKESPTVKGGAKVHLMKSKQPRRSRVLEQG